jgi:hypothetical protein
MPVPRDPATGHRYVIAAVFAVDDLLAHRHGREYIREADKADRDPAVAERWFQARSEVVEPD